MPFLLTTLFYFINISCKSPLVYVQISFLWSPWYVSLCWISEDCHLLELVQYMGICIERQKVICLNLSVKFQKSEVMLRSVIKIVSLWNIMCIYSVAVMHFTLMSWVESEITIQLSCFAETDVMSCREHQVGRNKNAASFSI